jgi:nicotinamidase/pyrazinamidase
VFTVKQDKNNTTERTNIMKRNIHLVIIDPQNDFCDLPTEYRPEDPLALKNPATVDSRMAPALPVPGAHEDMLRLSQFMQSGLRGLADISITLDSHHRIGIERPAFWQQGDGSAVTPFTQITAASVRAGQYLPRNPKATNRVLAYLDTLEAAGRYTLMVWPAHCEIGTWGHNVHADIRASYNMWEERELGIVNKVTKGSNPWTEHYSALMAEVPDADDPSTQLNRGFLDMTIDADLVLITGEAGSHCVKSTAEHFADNFGAAAKKLVLVTDCMSPVTGFEAQYQQFLADMQGRGVQLATTADLLPELVANARR